MSTTNAVATRPAAATRPVARPGVSRATTSRAATSRGAGRLLEGLARMALVGLLIGSVAAVLAEPARREALWAGLGLTDSSDAGEAGATAGSQDPGGWVVAGSKEAASLAPAAHWSDFTAPQREDIDQGVGVLTETDEIGAVAHTRRWLVDEVPVHVSLPLEYGPGVDGAVTEALAWLSATTGVRFVRSDNPNAPVQVAGQDGDQGHAYLRVKSSGEVVGARITIGCCRERIVWEEISHISGALGDRANQDRLFSEGYGTARPTAFDAWAIHTSYQLPAGSSPDQVRAALGG